MCLITEFREPIIAEDDIRVYKELVFVDKKTARSSFFYKFEYTLKKLYKTEFKFIKPKLSWAPYDYVDSMYLIKNFPEMRATGDKTGLICISEGFHSAAEKNRLIDMNYSLYECTIPKGATYYTNTRGLYVSNKIIINRQIKGI